MAVRLECTIRLIRNTTWRTGYVQRLIIRELQRAGGTLSYQELRARLAEHVRHPREISQAMWRLAARKIIEVMKL